MDKNYIVKKSNDFIMNTSYDLSLEEQKLILTLASMVQPSDKEFKPYLFKIAEFMKLLGVATKTKYTEIPKITKALMKKVFEIQEGDTLIQTAWLSGARYTKGSGMVTLNFNPDLKPYMLKLSTMFTQYKLSNILSMKSKYSPRIYEFLKCNEFKKQGYIDIEIDDLRQLLKVENIYPRYYDFRRFILETSQKELKKLTDISFDFEETRYGRKVTSIRFYIHSKKTNEIAATKIDAVAEAPKEKENYIDNVKSIIKIVTGEAITDKSANEIYKCATKHKKYGNNPLELINEVAEYSKTQSIKGFIGWFKSTVTGYEKPIETSKRTAFNDYEQRSYDYNDLEKKLLGWNE
jgi:plasmid replication initiation protein